MDELLAAYDTGRPGGRHPGPALADHARQLHLGREPRKRCAELGVGADLQPAWLWKDTRTLLKVLGPEADGLVPPLPQVARRRPDDRRRQRPHDPPRPDRGHQPVGPLARASGSP